MKRKKLSEIHKKRISLALKGRKKPFRTEEHCKNLSKAFKGRIPWNKGRVGVYSSEVRKRIGRTLKEKGIKPPGRKGAKLSEGHKEILRNVWVNRKRSKQNRINSSLGARKRVLEGNHNFYRGGLVSLKNKIRDSVQYRLWREEVFKRDNYTCVDCGARNGYGKTIYLEADHVRGLAEIIRLYRIKTFDEALDCSAIWDVSNGETRCQECHGKTYNYGRKEVIRLDYLFNNT